MIKTIYYTLPERWQLYTRQAWLQENDGEIRTFYNRIERPQANDYKLFSIIWGVPIEELMCQIGFKSIKAYKPKKTEVRYMMQAVDFMNKENKQTEIPL